MNKTLEEILKLIGIYIGYLLLTILFFYLFGFYVWNQPPTKIVLTRMIVLPFILTLTTEVFIICIKKINNQKKDK